MVEVEITTLAITQRYGTLQSGVILRTDEAYAEHLVKEANCAKYSKPAVVVPGTSLAETLASAPAPATSPAPAPAPRRERKSKKQQASAPAQSASAPPPASAPTESTPPVVSGEELGAGSSSPEGEEAKDSGSDLPPADS